MQEKYVFPSNLAQQNLLSNFQKFIFMFIVNIRSDTDFFYVYSSFLVYCYCYLSMSFSIFLLRFLGFPPIFLISKGYLYIKEMNFLTVICVVNISPSLTFIFWLALWYNLLCIIFYKIHVVNYMNHFMSSGFLFCILLRQSFLIPRISKKNNLMLLTPWI